ncbi:hypothetical protein C8024_06635 [Sphingopyxis sp. BSNA05]|uniref:hypothetical protein n=1 Tax=Sphingopyxis sp. BSNA05 TaxID=1236614 RepID=UPI001566DEFB|nr:hypothetical protein [Sphingopyxis sp. BSNA05]NRD89185.1 hypothetical protein [Sphingopyxis sp. BSNA05]
MFKQRFFLEKDPVQAGEILIGKPGDLLIVEVVKMLSMSIIINLDNLVERQTMEFRHKALE